MENVLSQLNIDKLKEIDYSFMNRINYKDFEVKKQPITLKNNETINLYKEFIMIRKQIFDEIIIDLYLINKLSDNIYYTHKDGDFLTISNYQKNIICFGEISKQNLFNIKNIFDFTFQNDMREELEELKKIGVDNYIEKKTVFNKEDSKDYFSPIFAKDKILGVCYIYSPGINYSNYTDYSRYLSNAKLKNALKLYDFYVDFRNKMNSSQFDEEKYYLIKKEIMIQIKNRYYFSDIKTILENDKMLEKEKNEEKKLLYLLKMLSSDVLEKVINNIGENKINLDFTSEPNAIPVITSKSKSGESLAMIYDNFELIPQNIASLFIQLNSFFSWEKIKIEYYLECFLKDGKVVLKYPKHMLNNQKYISVIGTLDDKNTFINEYCLIYTDDYRDYYYHTDKLKKENINNFLNQQRFKNDSASLINDYGEIGIIVKLQNSGKNHTNSINNNFDNNSNNNFNYNFEHNQIADENYKKIENKQIKIDDDYPKDKYEDLIKYENYFADPNDEKYNLNSQIPVTSIIDYYTQPPLIGLDNIGATCYMNATLQCLCNIKKFVDYFKYNKHLIDIVRKDRKKKQLCSSFKLLIEKLWPEEIVDNSKNNKKSNRFLQFFGYQNEYESYESEKKNKSFPPNEFKEKISTMNSLFKGVAANDAKDLVQFLIMTLHNELNGAKGDNNIRNIPVQDQRNKQLMFQTFGNDFMANNLSLISDLFYAVNYSITQCGCCGAQTYNYQTYFFLVFPLEEVRIFKSQNAMNFNYNNYFNNNEVNIYDCFIYDQKITSMAGNNAMYCNYCKQTCNNSMRTILATGPEILIIILNRGKGTEFKVKINFLEQIDLTNFIEMNQTGCKYNLIGVITHIGESGMGGHFIAYCRNPISKDWHKYNDSIVTPVTDFKKDVIDFAMPYLLFYQKIS